MQDSSPVRRFEGAPTVRIGGVEVPVAVGFRARLLGLAGLEPAEAGPGLLIPRCSSVHTFGMRFPLDLVFLDRRQRPVAVWASVPARRIAGHAGAAAVLELPSVAGSGKFATDGGDSGGASPG
jgi:uncharacterized protein